MELEKLVRTRRSVRGYKKDPVPRALIEAIVEIAKGAPSSMNSQPWHVHVLTGAPLDEVRRRNMEEMEAGVKSKWDIFTHGPYEGVHRERQVAIAKKLFAVMGIERHDQERRQDWVRRGFRQFGQSRSRAEREFRQVYWICRLRYRSLLLVKGRSPGALHARSGLGT